MLAQLRSLSYTCRVTQQIYAHCIQERNIRLWFWYTGRDLKTSVGCSLSQILTQASQKAMSHLLRQPEGWAMTAVLLKEPCLPPQWYSVLPKECPQVFQFRNLKRPWLFYGGEEIDTKPFETRMHLSFKVFYTKQLGPSNFRLLYFRVCYIKILQIHTQPYYNGSLECELIFK